MIREGRLPPRAAKGACAPASTRPRTSTTCSATSIAKLRKLKVVVEPGQRRRRALRRPARAAPAVRVRQGAPRARRHVPERRAEPDARGEPQADDRGDPPQRGRRRARLGRRLRPLLLLRRERPFHRGLLPGRPAGADGAEARARRAHRPRPAAHLEHDRDRAGSTAARRCCASRATPSSSRRCARSTAPMVAR
jgi:hypothetical protein